MEHEQSETRKPPLIAANYAPYYYLHCYLAMVKKSQIATQPDGFQNLTSCAEAATICHAPCKLTFDLLTLKMVSESCVTWATSVPILVFLDLSVLCPTLRAGA